MPAVARRGFEVFESEYLSKRPELRLTVGGKSPQGEDWAISITQKRQISPEERRLGVKCWGTPTQGITDAQIEQLAQVSLTDKHMAMGLKDILIEGKSYDDVTGKNAAPILAVPNDDIERIITERVEAHMRLRTLEVMKEHEERIKKEAVAEYVKKAVEAANAPQSDADAKAQAKALTDVGRKKTLATEDARKKVTVALYRQKARKLGYPDWETMRINGGVMHKINREWGSRESKEMTAELLEKPADSVPATVEQAVAIEVRDG